MSATDEGRTEQATEKQREKFRDEGSVAKSNELNSFVSFFAGFAVLSLMGAHIALSIGEMMRHAFQNLNAISLAENLQTLNFYYFKRYMLLLAPIFLALFVSVAAVNIAQFGFKISWKAIKPKFSKVNPFANFRKVLLSANSLFELIKSVVKITMLTLLTFWAIRPLMNEFVSMLQLTPLQTAMKTWEYVEIVWMVIIVFMLALGLADFSWQKYQLEEKMKMKPQDVEDEMKQSFGDPEIKRRQRQKGRQLLQSLAAQKTEEADVVITNPTHFAVALRYKHAQMGAPKVMAKGVDYVALRIRKQARHANIPIVENRGLARALYYSVEMDQEIPEKLFRPVAEILAFIYKLNKERASA